MNDQIRELAEQKLAELCRTIVTTKIELFPTLYIYGTESMWRTYVALNPAGVSFPEFTDIVESKHFRKALGKVLDQRLADWTRS